MKYRLPLRCYALVLCAFPCLAGADEPPAAWAPRRVEDGLIKPLAQHEGGSRFSRKRPPPRERRVRLTQDTPSIDKQGRAFVGFAVDVRFGDAWRENDIVGCVYQKSGELYVNRGDGYRPAAFLLGKNVAAVPGVCVASESKSARS